MEANHLCTSRSAVCTWLHCAHGAFRPGAPSTYSQGAQEYVNCIWQGGHFFTNSGVMSEKLNCLVQEYTQVRGNVCMVSCGLRISLGISWNLSFTEKFLNFFPCVLLGAPYSLNDIFVAFFCETHRGLDGHVFRAFVLPVGKLWTKFNPSRMTLVIARDKFCRSRRLSWLLLSSRLTERFLKSLCFERTDFTSLLNNWKDSLPWVWGILSQAPGSYIQSYMYHPVIKSRARACLFNSPTGCSFRKMLSGLIIMKLTYYS